MRKLITLIAAIAVVSFSASLAEAKRKNVGPNPCDGDFELKISVSALGGLEESEPVTLSIEVPKGASRGIASRVHAEQKSEFDQKACRNWQAKYWPHLDRILWESGRFERSKTICRNLASIEMRLGAKRESAKVCLGDSNQDGVSNGFRRFYNGTDLLVAR